MKILFIASLITCLVLSSMVLGQTGPSLNKVSPEGLSDEEFDELAYKKTLQLCTQINQMNNVDDEINISWEFIKFAVDGTLSGLQLWKEDSLSISSSTRSLVKSKGYQAAVAHCYPNTMDQRLFTGLIISEDAGGHILGFISWMVPISRLSKAFAATKWAIENPGVMKGVGTAMSFVKYATLTALAGMTAYDGYQQYDVYKNGAKYLAEYDDQMEKMASQVSDENFKKVLNRLAWINKKLEIEKDPIKIKNLLYQKGLLEERVRDHNTPRPPEPEEDNNVNVPPK